MVGFEIVLGKHFDITKLSGSTLYAEFRLPDICRMPYLVFTFRGTQGGKIFVEQFYNKVKESGEETHDYDATDEGNEYTLVA